MEDAYIIRGGKPLRGEVTLSGAKNVSLKAMIAALLFQGEVILENVPRINDVLELIHLLTSLGVTVAFTEKNTLHINASTMNNSTIDLLHASKTRVSFMLAAPLLHHFSKCHIPNPGGCRLGARPIDRIIEGMESLGVSSEYSHESGYYQLQMKPDGISGVYTFPKPSHTGTELLVMLGALATGMVTIENAALEPEIDELIAFLNEGGAKIQRNGTSIEIEGVEKLVAPKPFRICSDRNEAVTFATLALATKGDILLRDVNYAHLETFISYLDAIGAGVERVSENEMRVYFDKELTFSTIETVPHPGFMTDWQPNWAILMTQARGSSYIHERMFENRFAYVSELKKLGAKIDFIELPVDDPSDFYHFHYEPDKIYQQAIKIKGKQKLHNGVLEISDLRAGASLVTAALIATGESVVQGVSVVERGYEDLVPKIRSLGGDIKKI
ncbi:UDP-N-acetylglucosamine 1-carboxyvinyltransferase [Candidatus Roizmanbacteria bacterium]|nr:UDP-N-acetylglucosamine 1-carboxyvinyltransferase [Candidatus Roizmanbacteria bacterium]